MTLGPDDLPDPFGEGGMSQLVCGCTSETFLFVFTETTVRAICKSCKAMVGEWLKEPLPPDPFTEYQFIAREPGTYRIDMRTGQVLSFAPRGGAAAAQHTWTPGCDGLHSAGPCPVPPQSRDTMGARPRVQAGWDMGAPLPVPVTSPAQPPGYRHGLPPPALPAFSAGMCNAYLDGGPYDGQITWLMAGSTDFRVPGWGTYLATAKVRDGRVVYRVKEEG